MQVLHIRLILTIMQFHDCVDCHSVHNIIDLRIYYYSANTRNYASLIGVVCVQLPRVALKSLLFASVVHLHRAVSDIHFINAARV